MPRWTRPLGLRAASLPNATNFLSPNPLTNNALQAAAPHMREAAKAEIAASGRPRPRCILNVSSVSGARCACWVGMLCVLSHILHPGAVFCLVGRVTRIPLPTKHVLRLHAGLYSGPFSWPCAPTIPCPAGVHGSIGQANYATAKAGVVGLTKAVAKEWGPFGVRCNCLTYGYINTRCAVAEVCCCWC